VIFIKNYLPSPLLQRKTFGEQRVGALIRDLPGLGADARRKLLAGNAQRFLGLGV
jgi:hypothetical protein